MKIRDSVRIFNLWKDYIVYIEIYHFRESSEYFINQMLYKEWQSYWQKS